METITKRMTMVEYRGWLQLHGIRPDDDGTRALIRENGKAATVDVIIEIAAERGVELPRKSVQHYVRAQANKTT